MATKVFVGNLAFRTTDQDLQTHFAGHGEMYVLSVTNQQ